MRLRKVHYAAFLTVGALCLTSACSGGGGGGGKSGGSAGNATVQNFGIGTAAQSQGPAKAVTGAKKGGTVTDIEPTGIDYLDPGQIYVSNELAIAQLYSRTLTNYKIDPKTGKTILVGDLATDTGTSSDGGKTWTFHLKSGLKFEDGTTITSQDIKYGIERLYESFETQGPTYVPIWLSGNNYRKTYEGPQHGKSLPSSLIATPNDKTIVFHFKASHPDAPYAMAMANVSPIEKSKDDGPKYNNHPVSTGPYKIASYKPGKSLVLVRNKYWDPKTDPIRHAYPDKWNLQLGIQNPGLTQRLMTAQGGDKDALSLSQPADPSQMSTLISDPQYKSRTVNQYQPYVEVFNVNAKRVTNPKVRQAIAYALPTGQLQRQLGGAAQGDVGTTLLSPTVGGYKKFDPFGKLTMPNGNIAKAKALLKAAGDPHPKIVFAYASPSRWDDPALTVQKYLKKAGFNVVLKPLDATSYYTLIGKADNPYDMYRSGWGADWPVASTVVPPTLDGRTIGDGSPNYSHLNDPYVNKEIDRIGKIQDIAKQSAAWEKLTEYILTKDTTQIPFLYDKFFQIYGPGLGGVTYNQVYGTVNPNTVFVK
jgi:peptide/nickel transport system substrate-binding protein